METDYDETRRNSRGSFYGLLSLSRKGTGVSKGGSRRNSKTHHMILADNLVTNSSNKINRQVSQSMPVNDLVIEENMDEIDNSFTGGFMNSSFANMSDNGEGGIGEDKHQISKTEYEELVALKLKWVAEKKGLESRVESLLVKNIFLIFLGGN